MRSLIHITPGLAVTGELRREDFAALASRGYRAVISNRPDGEDDRQLTARLEAALSWRAGLKFAHVPVGSLELFEDGPAEAMADALAVLQGPVVAHCQSGLRSALVWAAASARSQPVDCVIGALAAVGFDGEAFRDELARQAGRKRWLGRHAALDCASASSIARPAM